MAEINKIHVAPGVYVTDTVDMKEAANSLGITKLALVGETLKGPAFEPYWIHSPKEFANVFGGTNPAKFKGTNYPKYELPYIANEYLSQSDQLCVVRTLGFSGSNMGPAWVLTGSKDINSNKFVIAVLRSKGSYKFRPEFVKTTTAGCQCSTAYDSLTYDVGETNQLNSCGEPKVFNSSAVTLTNYQSINNQGNSCSDYSLSTGSKAGFAASSGDLGRFTIQCIVGPTSGDTGVAVTSKEASGYTIVNIPVSLNKGDNDYIENVLGTTPDDGAYPLYVETLYDVAWENLVMGEGYNKIDQELQFYSPYSTGDYSGLDPVYGFLTKYDSELNKKDLGKRFLYSTEFGSPKSGITAYEFNYTENNGKKADSGSTVVVRINENGVASAKKGNGNVTSISNGELVHIYSGTSSNVTDNQDWGYFKNKSNSALEVSNVYSATNKKIHEKLQKVNLDGLDAYVQASGFTEGQIYTVALIKDNLGIKHYVYRYYGQEDVIKALDPDKSNNWTTSDLNDASKAWSATTYEQYVRAIDRLNSSTNSKTDTIKNKFGRIVYNYEDGLYYKMNASDKVDRISCDLNDYKSGFRYSSTPWIVSNAKGDAKNIELNKLFRFHTISDGNNSVNEIKVSIENIRPDSGQFDVVVRDFYDNDGSPVVLERFAKCTMAPGRKFIGTMIGTIDGLYESKSKYITVEVAESEAAINSVPAGFLGYPIPQYSGATIGDDSHSGVTLAPITYNKMYDEDVNLKKQYMGISDRVGYDRDYFTYKGKMASYESPEFISHGFHLDCRIDKNSYANSISETPKITVDGEKGYIFDTVSINARTNKLNQAPIIASEDDMYGSIFEDVKARKFTVAFFGGYDGWDVYRESRTNTNEFTASAYKGYINKNNGIGYAFDSFNTFNNGDLYNLDGGAITTDYYATLAGVSMLKNSNEVDVNLLATPGIDTVNNSRLMNDIFEILEDRNDIFYIATTPDKEPGTSDFESDVLPVEYAVADFVDQDLHCDYVATYYPWVKIEDNGRYLFVPPTKDVVRNMAESDNRNTTQNLAPAGLTRGRVNGIRARKNLKDGEADALYEAQINPVRTFSQEGLVVMGQKTLREEDDLKNRIDVMRTMIRMRKLLATATLGLVFEPNDDATVKSFTSIVNGVMQTFIDNRAIEKWKMDVDTSEEARDRLEINAVIYFKPVRALEYVNFTLVATNKEVYFE